MEAGLPEEDSEMSREGKLLHDYAAHPEYERKVLTPQQQDLLALADSLTQTVIDMVHGENSCFGIVQHFREQTLEGEYISGTPDFLGYCANSTALLIDRKFGYAVVERAELNLQLRTYAVLASGFKLEPLEKVFVSIVQPRATFAERITIASYTPDDIHDSRKQIVQILAASEQDDAPLVAGEIQCRYCKAKLLCPAFQKAMMVPDVITPDTALSKAAKEAYLEKCLAECSDEQLEKVIEAERLAKMIHSPLYEEARKRIANGEMINFTVSKDSVVREVADVGKAMALLSLSGFDRPELYACVKKFSLPDAEEIVRKKHANWTWQQARDWCNKKLASVIELQTRKGRVMRKNEISQPD